MEDVLVMTVAPKPAHGFPCRRADQLCRCDAFQPDRIKTVRGREWLNLITVQRLAVDGDVGNASVDQVARHDDDRQYLNADRIVDDLSAVPGPQPLEELDGFANMGMAAAMPPDGVGFGAIFDLCREEFFEAVGYHQAPAFLTVSCSTGSVGLSSDLAGKSLRRSKPPVERIFMVPSRFSFMVIVAGFFFFAITHLPSGRVPVRPGRS
ncbi:hypothetical protein Avi_3023 [Allorhizobium ampelinum S4]|uniref:Uncharacterized protein n=1 Tax=Allorhizobium ampelinum (strain ATCC BAA-846 / DSM 112012 / S4) TaxID=311402 RepID=B9JYE8_ALLAM|nr:hypothetical protein Avi_3023 [Allorhizobium ampelinum S4]